jgi:hypothetical protein
VRVGGWLICRFVVLIHSSLLMRKMQPTSNQSPRTETRSDSVVGYLFRLYVHPRNAYFLHDGLAGVFLLWSSYCWQRVRARLRVLGMGADI